MYRILLASGFVLSFLFLFLTKEDKPVAEHPAEKPPIQEIEISGMNLKQVSYADFKGWEKDNLLESLAALKRSCVVTAKRRPEWKKFCSDIDAQKFRSNKAVRKFFEQNLIPFSVNAGETGLFTGYYEPEIEGSIVKTQVYQTPLYELPEDIVRIDLNRFNPKYKGEVFFGRLDGKEVKPYFTREEIEKNDKFPARILAWVKHPADAFILQIQGSGLVRLPDGKALPVGYAGNNGHKFVGIGSIMAKKGLLKRGVYTMAEIKEWLKKNPVEAKKLMHQNPRFIFFKKLNDNGAIGSLGVPLTAQRSVAVDPAFIPLGSILWLETTDPDGRPLNRIVAAQDTGTAIKGAIRGDFFWGAGDKALLEAGRMRSRGTYYLLLPLEAARAFQTKDDMNE